MSRKSKDSVIKRPYKKGSPFYLSYTKVHKPKPKPVFETTVKYSFLEYIKVVFKWATENSGLKRTEVEVLLFLYPKGVFVRREFFEFMKIISMFQGQKLKKYMEEGWIKVYKKRTKKGESTLYSLTQKGKKLCSDIHLMCTGEKKIPEVENKLNSSKVRQHSYYMDVIKKMNKRKK